MNKIYINSHAVSASFITMDEISKVIPEWMQAKNRFALVGRHDQLPTNEYCYIDAYSGWGASPEDDRTLCSIEFALNARFQEEARYLVYMPEDGDDPAIVAAVNAQLCPLNEEPFTIPTWFEIIKEQGDKLKYGIAHMVLWDMDRNHRYGSHTYDQAALSNVVNDYVGTGTCSPLSAAASMHNALEFAFDPAKNGGVKLGSMAIVKVETKGSTDSVYTCELLLNVEGWHGRDIPVDEDKSDSQLMESSGIKIPDAPPYWFYRKRWVGVRSGDYLGHSIMMGGIDFKRYVDIKTGWGISPDEPETMCTFRQALNAMLRGDVVCIAYVADNDDNPALVETVNEELFGWTDVDLCHYPCHSEYSGPTSAPHIADLLEDTDFELVEDGWAPLDEEDSSQSDPIIN